MSNAIVRPIAVTHQVVPHQFQWIINSRTLVEKVNDDEVNNVVPNYNFCLFSKVKEYLNVASQVSKLIVSCFFFLKKNHYKSTNIFIYTIAYMSLALLS